MFFKRKKTDKKHSSERRHKSQRTSSSTTRALEQFVVEEVVLSGEVRQTTSGRPLPQHWVGKQLVSNHSPEAVTDRHKLRPLTGLDQDPSTADSSSEPIPASNPVEASTVSPVR